jgi:acetylcholinesterase
VNIFGFPNAAGLNSSELNLGLLDQRLGLEWYVPPSPIPNQGTNFKRVRSNIASFGGDVSRITLWGQSAGAASVDYYNHAYAHDPIISGLIMDSGTAFIPIGTNDTTHSSFSIVAQHFNCPTANSSSAAEELNCLKKVKQEDIENFLQSYQNAGTSPSLSFNTVVDGRTKFANYTQHTLSKDFTLLPAIIGTNTNEGVAFTPFTTSLQGPNQTAANALTLRVLLCPADVTTSLRYEVGAKTYRYLYAGNFSNIAPRSWEGAYHSSELPLIFGTSGIARGTDTALETTLSERMQDLWLAFASNPENGLEKEGWEEYRPGGSAVVLGEDGVLVGSIGTDELEAPCLGLDGKAGAVPPLAPAS